MTKQKIVQDSFIGRPVLPRSEGEYTSEQIQTIYTCAHIREAYRPVHQLTRVRHPSEARTPQAVRSVSKAAREAKPPPSAATQKRNTTHLCRPRDMPRAYGMLQ